MCGNESLFHPPHALQASFSRLREADPDRVVQIRYEDFASDPMAQSLDLYRKLGEDWCVRVCVCV